MSQRLFKVDLTDGARDFKPMATEPGLAMLDRNNANYAILRRWLGDYVAEPEWKGQDMHFFVREEARGRLENVHCIPCTKADLLGPLQEQLEEIDQKLRKAKPETANEQLLHRIIRKQFADLTANYDASDFHCHFFKYRQGSEPWRLIWVWGYQRTDLEPARSIICGNAECEALYTKRAKQRARCPVCSSLATRGRKPPVPLWLRLSQTALLLLLLLGAVLFFLFNQPRLVVTPMDWSGPPGSRVQYKVEHKRWFFWNDDVTDKVVSQSEDKRIMRFEPSGALAKARASGNALLSFHFRNLSGSATAHVGPPIQPARVSLDPEDDIKVFTGATQQATLWGHYDEEDGLDPVDLSEMAEWTAEKPAILLAHPDGKLEGGTEGVSTITARYRASEDDPWLDATAKVSVLDIDYQSIELAVVPGEFGLGQSGRLEVNGIGPKGEKISLVGSSLLKLNVSPENAAKVDGEYLIGLAKGKAKLSASFLADQFTNSTEFTVGDSTLAAGTLIVSPQIANVRVDEYLELDVVSASSKLLVLESSDANVIDVVGERTIVGRAPGSATVTITQGGSSTTIAVNVISANLITIHIDPSPITLVSGEARPIRVYARDKNGEKIDVAPDRITWVKQPPLDYVRLSRDSLTLTGLSPSLEEWPLMAQLGTNENIRTETYVKVIGNSTATVVDLGEFGAHPPIPIAGRRTIYTGPYLGEDLLYDGDGLVVGDVDSSSILYRSGLPAGTRITRVGDRDLTGLSATELERIFRDRTIRPSDVITYRMADGSVGRIKLGITGRIIQDVRLVDVTPENLSPTDFNANVTLELREAAEYRITDAAGEPLSSWQELGPSAVASLMTEKINRNPIDDYELFVERKIGENVKRYQLAFTLTTSTATPE